MKIWFIFVFSLLVLIYDFHKTNKLGWLNNKQTFLIVKSRKLIRRTRSYTKSFYKASNVHYKVRAKAAEVRKFTQMPSKQSISH